MYQNEITSHEQNYTPTAALSHLSTDLTFNQLHEHSYQCYFFPSLKRTPHFSKKITNLTRKSYISVQPEVLNFLKCLIFVCI